MITIYQEKPRVFEWEGIRVGMRLPLVDEMKKITAMRDAFFGSISEVKPQGDQTIMVDFQFLVGSSLACDPDNARNPWFAADVEEQHKLATNGVQKQLASELPAPFFVAATAFFNREVLKADKTDDEREKAEEGRADLPLETPGTEMTPTPQSSDDSSSVSQNISPSTPPESTSGDTTVS